MMSEAEVAQLGRGYQGDIAGRLGLSDADAKKWTDFTQQMEKAGLEIEDVFARRAVGLTAPLGHLSDAFVGLVANLMKDSKIKIKDWIGDLGKGVQHFAELLGSGAAQDKAAAIGKEQPCQTTNCQSYQDRAYERSKDEQGESFRHWMMHDAAGFFTFCLVIVGGFQLALFRVQLKFIRESLTDAKVAADAATEAAKAAGLNARAAISAYPD